MLQLVSDLAASAGPNWTDVICAVLPWLGPILAARRAWGKWFK